MKQFEISDNEVEEAALRSKLRNDTGIDPELMNHGLKEMQRVARTLLALADRPEKSLSPGRESFLMYAQHISHTISNLRDYMIQALATQYLRYIPLNVAMLLDASKFVIRMDNKVGVGNFDAHVMEDQMVEMIPKFNEMALKSILDKARATLPNLQQLQVENMLNGCRLNLITHGRECWDHATIEIGKLSRIVLLGEEAATVMACRSTQHVPGSSTDTVVMATGEPIISISYNRVMADLMSVEYETAESARRVAEALLKWEVN